MKKEDIIFTDWHRWLFGTAPPAFTLEAALRAVVMFVVVVLVVRWMGRRLKGEISIAEWAVILTLGGIITKPLHLPTMGLLPPVAVLLTLLGMHRLSNWLAFKYRPVELAQQGDVVALLRDGCLDLPKLRATALSQEQLFSLLRAQKIQQLGQLRRVYLEANGKFSLYKYQQARAGLSILPRPDQPAPAANGPAHGRLACATCGHVAAPADHSGTGCLRCGAHNWLPAAL